MILSGNLNNAAFLDALKLIGSARKTGILRAARKEQEIRLYWKSGTVVAADQQPSLSDLGADLRSRKAIQELLAWQDGDFEFTEGPLDAGIEVQSLQIHTQSLLIEVSRRLVGTQHLQDAFPERTTIFRLAPLPDSSLGHIRLGSEEWAVLSLVNGHRTLQEILDQGGAEENRTLQALFGLLTAGLIVQIESSEDDESGKLELGRVKYSRILELYMELHSILVERLFEAAPTMAAGQLQMACSKLAKAYPKIWGNVPLESSRYLPGSSLLANILKMPAEQRVYTMMQAFGHLLLKEILTIRHLLGDDDAKSALADIRSILQLAPRRFPEVSSKILRHIKNILQQAEQIPSRYKMGFDFFEKHHYEDAIRLWKSIPQTNPQYDSAQALISQARQLTEGRSKMRLALERGESLLTEGRLIEALDVWQNALANALESNSQDSTRKTLQHRLEEMTKVMGLLQEAAMQIQERRYEEARQKITEALTLAPDLTEAKNLHARLLEKADKLSSIRELAFSGLDHYRSGRYPEAIETFRRVLALEPRHQLSEDHMRFSFEKLHSTLETDPRYAVPWAASKRSAWIQAIERWEYVLEQRPSDSIASFFLREARFASQGERLFQEAATYCVANNFPKALELLDRILKDRPNLSEAKILQENVRRHLAQQEKLDQLLVQAEQRFEAGDIATARQLTERILEIEPEHKLAKLAQARIMQVTDAEPAAPGTGTFRAALSMGATEEKTAMTPMNSMSKAIQEEIDEPTQAAAKMPLPNLPDEGAPDLGKLSAEMQRRLKR